MFLVSLVIHGTLHHKSVRIHSEPLPLICIHQSNEVVDRLGNLISLIPSTSKIEWPSSAPIKMTIMVPGRYLTMSVGNSPSVITYALPWLVCKAFPRGARGCGGGGDGALHLLSGDPEQKPPRRVADTRAIRYSECTHETCCTFHFKQVVLKR